MPPEGHDSAVPTSKVAEVFANNTTQLLRVDLTTNTLSLVGTFTGAGCGRDMQDVALDDNSNMYATDGTRIWRVDPKTAQCLSVAVNGGGLPIAITFLPTGAFGSSAQMLFGYTHTEAVTVNLGSGTVTPRSSVGGGYSLSGDFVSVNGGPTYVSVTGNGCRDCLVEVDTTTGAITKSWGSLGHSGVYGLAFWGGVIYGFDGAGEVLEVTFNADAGTVSTTVLNINPQHYAFTGAGSTTAAPLVPSSPK